VCSSDLIDSTLSVDDLNKKEAVWLDHYRNLTEVYNIREAGNNKLHSDKSILKMQESQRQAHARRRAEGRDGGWKRIDGGAMKGKSHPCKGTSGMWSYTEEQKKEQSKRMSEINKAVVLPHRSTTASRHSVHLVSDATSRWPALSDQSSLRAAAITRCQF
jgi:hypothetical protein